MEQGCVPFSSLINHKGGLLRIEENLTSIITLIPQNPHKLHYFVFDVDDVDVFQVIQVV